ncbi:metallophosphoesterase [Candidatus Daviesbacteria bacterium]|nr:metallophosphoesterase [Candidatus Daviesbacteria bacterium]
MAERKVEEPKKLQKTIPAQDIIPNGSASKSKQKEMTQEDRLRASLALEALLPQKIKPIQSLDQVHKIYQTKDESNKIDELKYDIKSDSVRTLYLSEILAGNNTADLPFLIETIQRIKGSPEEYQPDIVVVSGLLEGNYKFRDKDRRSTLVLSLDQQFATANLILKELEGLGSEIIYSLSTEDREICRDGTIEAMRALQNTAKPLIDKNKGLVTYWQIDQIKQNPAWDTHLKFQTNVVFEYCLRSGRRLKSAEEVKEATKGKIMMEEYLMLYDAFQKLVKLQDIPAGYREVLELDNIPLPDKKFSAFELADDMDLVVNANSNNFTQKVKHNFKFGAKPLTRNPTDVPEAITRQLSSEGIKPPNALITLSQHQTLGVGDAENTWMISTGSFLDTSKTLDQKGSIASAGRAPSWRSLTTRKIVSLPTATMHEFTDDGRHVITFYNKKLLEKADYAERTTILTITDWQTGSMSARPDLQVKLLDLAISEILPGRPMWVLSTGDLFHGQNYKGLSMENFRTGQIRIEDQQRFVQELLERSTSHISTGNLSNIAGVSIVPGNHEWNSNYVNTGAIFNLSLVNSFRNLLKTDVETAGKKVRASELLDTPNGDVVPVWSSFDEIAGYGVLSQHMYLDKAGGKVPIYHAQKFIEGSGDFGRKIDISSTGHWHHNQYAVFGNKLHVINPSVAGLTNYEMMKGLRPTVGGALIHVGGGLPVQVEFLSLDTLLSHKITDGYFSDENLAREGFIDDRHFDPKRDGYFHRKSALQKALWGLHDELIKKIDSHL